MRTPIHAAGIPISMHGLVQGVCGRKAGTWVTDKGEGKLKIRNSNEGFLITHSINQQADSLVEGMFVVVCL